MEILIAISLVIVALFVWTIIGVLVSIAWNKFLGNTIYWDFVAFEALIWPFFTLIVRIPQCSILLVRKLTKM